jgi:hypothetical protein
MVLIFSATKYFVTAAYGRDRKRIISMEIRNNVSDNRFKNILCCQLLLAYYSAIR